MYLTLTDIIKDSKLVSHLHRHASLLLVVPTTEKFRDFPSECRRRGEVGAHGYLNSTAFIFIFMLFLFLITNYIVRGSVRRLQLYAKGWGNVIRH